MKLKQYTQKMHNTKVILVLRIDLISKTQTTNRTKLISLRKKSSK